MSEASETVTIASAVQLLKDYYQMSVTAEKLPGELDLNFKIKASNGEKYILKIANSAEQLENLELQHAAMQHLEKKDFGLTTSVPVKNSAGIEIFSINDLAEQKRFVRLLTWVEGRVFANAAPHSPELLSRLGELCGKLSKSLQGFDHPAAHRFLKWDPRQTDWIKDHFDKFSKERKHTVEHFFDLFSREALPLFDQLRQSVNYNDANDFNVLVDADPASPQVPGVIDFGDLVYTHTINELAIALAYAMMHKENPLEAACHVVRGYHQIFPLTETELKVLFPLTVARLLISVTCAEINRAEHPQNAYLQISDAPAWILLNKLQYINSEFAHYAFRSVCNLEPVPQRPIFEKWVESNSKKFVHPVDPGNQTQWLDLSAGSPDLGTMSEILNPVSLCNSINRMLSNSVALGRYDEARAIYSTEAYQIKRNDGWDWRTVHIGLDYFSAAGTAVKAPLKGTVYSVANNNQERDYGPTIILQHQAGADLTFYTLYGHLSNDSISAIAPGMVIEAGEIFARIGTFEENGKWSPQLHFQIMLDMLGNRGDFPGVCTPAQADIWKSICPDPWKFFTGSPTPRVPSMEKSEIVKYRRQHLGKNMSISYRDPIKMVRGDRQFLIDHQGRRYLDTVNNVAHVGHEHPRVVAAGQRQMAVLNTNTRYLHDNLVLFVEALLKEMPPELNVAFLVNSGSEANELAIRLAKTYTNQKDMIVSQVGYHGNTNACVEVSSYKFDGAGGKGAMPHIHVVPIPDTYRGLYRSNDPEAGMKYAAHVGGAIAQTKNQGRGIAGMIFESVISCGGQVELPQKFLSEAYRMVRNAGGICIADEVQTGLGRAGNHFWAFQEHDVVPDVVTIGKPIGNGHPLGVVVTTQAVADAFKNGMEYFNTFGGNPVSCAIGREVLRVIKDEGLQQHALKTGNYLKAGLTALMKDFPIIGDVRGPGLFIGFELVSDPNTLTPATTQASWLANRMRDKGILMSTDGPFNNVLKIKPPMVFNQSDADFLLESISLVLKEDMMKV